MEDETTVLDVMRDIFEADQTFFNSIRFLDGHSRAHLTAAHLRNTAMALTILRNEPARMVVNIPIDLSGNFFDPIPIAPTTEQINAAVDTHVQVTETTCSICQDAVTCATRIRACGHCFHSQCIQQWFTMNPRCPMCRHDIRDR